MVFTHFQKVLQVLITKSISKIIISGLDYRNAELLMPFCAVESLDFDFSLSRPM